MLLEVKEIKGTRELKKFIKFPMSLYKGNNCYVPPIISFELSTLSEKNPALDHCKSRYWVVIKGGRIAGRIAGIVHGPEFEEKKLARFGWLDFVEDDEVLSLLFQTVEGWAAEQGAMGIHGPLGFTDNDIEATQVSGFDQLATQATKHNAQYYDSMIAAQGYVKAADWIEGRARVPEELPQRLLRSASIIENRFKITSKRFKNRKELLPYAKEVFEVLNASFQGLYGFYPLTNRQIDYYVKQYFGFVDKDFLSVIVNENDKVVAASISLPSLSRAFQKAKGHLFPFGFIHVLKALRSKEHLDMLLIGVDPEYQKLGANVLMFKEIFSAYKEKGVKHVSTGAMLEENRAVLNLWNEFEDQVDAKIYRRCYKKGLNQ